MLERLLGKRVLVVVERDFGYEGELATISHHPPGIWLSEAEAIVLRSTVVNPIPQVVSKEKKHELFLHLNSVLRIETAVESEKASEGE
jgi:predicted aconitase with swiveling domain